MKTSEPLTSMWLDACELLNRTERMRREFFGLIESEDCYACWEPPVDIFQTEAGLLVVALLPGSAATSIDVGIEIDVLTISGESPYPVPAGARILRLEIPYGAFRKHIQLPSPHYTLLSSNYRDGYLTLQLATSR